MTDIEKEPRYKEIYAKEYAEATGDYFNKESWVAKIAQKKYFEELIFDKEHRLKFLSNDFDTLHESYHDELKKNIDLKINIEEKEKSITHLRNEIQSRDKENFELREKGDALLHVLTEFVNIVNPIELKQKQLKIREYLNQL